VGDFARACGGKGVGRGIGCVKQLKGRAWGIRQEVGYRVVVGAGEGLPVVVGGVQVTRVR
jgi:hypothetical protein